MRPQNCETKCSHPFRRKSIKLGHCASSINCSAGTICCRRLPNAGRRSAPTLPAGNSAKRSLVSFFRAHPNFSYDFMIFHVLHNMRPAEEDELGPVWHQGGRRSREVLHLQILLMTSELKWRCVVNQLEGSLGSL